MCVGRMLTDNQHIVDTHVRPGPANVTAGRATLPLGVVVVLATTLEPAATIIALVTNNSCKWKGWVGCVGCTLSTWVQKNLYTQTHTHTHTHTHTFLGILNHPNRFCPIQHFHLAGGLEEELPSECCEADDIRSSLVEEAHFNVNALSQIKGPFEHPLRVSLIILDGFVGVENKVAFSPSL